MNDILMELLFTHKADFERIPDELIPVVRRIVDSALAAQRERLEQAASAAHCPECRKGEQPTYDEHWKAWYHDNLLCLGSTTRLAIRAQRLETPPAHTSE